MSPTRESSSAAMKSPANPSGAPISLPANRWWVTLLRVRLIWAKPSWAGRSSPAPGLTISTRATSDFPSAPSIDNERQGWSSTAWLPALNVSMVASQAKCSVSAVTYTSLKTKLFAISQALRRKVARQG